MAWYIMPAHNLAHIQPTLAQGTADANFPFGNVRTLNINQRARITPHATLGVQIDWNRGATDGIAVNAALILNNNMSAASTYWEIQSDSVSNFATPTVLINNSAEFGTDIFSLFDAGATSTEQYVRFVYAVVGGSATDFGLISVGEAFQVAAIGPQLQGESYASDGIWTQRFRPVTRANADTIVDRASRMYVHNTAKTVIDAMGGWEGRRPLAVINSTAQTVYYGLGKVTKQGIGKAANYSDLIVSIELERETVFG